jgi:hypothetical protein
MEPKSKVTSSTLVNSPRSKEAIDRKTGGSLIGLEENTKKCIDPLRYNGEGRENMETAQRKLSTDLMGKSNIHE